MWAAARVPIRLRLTLAFAGAMAVVLAATGGFLYTRLGAALDRSIDQGLHVRAADLAAVVSRPGSGLEGRAASAIANESGSFAQLLDARGDVIAPTREAGSQPLITRAQVTRALRAPVLVGREPRAGSDEPIRLLAAPATAPGGKPVVIVVGTSLEARGDALESLATLLLIGGPIALVLASLLGYGLATAALRPVESMRHEAAVVSAAEPGRRLPLPPANDEIRRLGETLNEMLGRLELALDRERRFVSDASHELRTPLALLRTELELALRRTRSAGELERAVRSAAEETERLSQLAEDLLVLARADQGTLPVRPERLRADELLGRVSARFAATASRAGRSLELEVEPADLELRGDRLRLEQAVGNLVDNALRHGRGRVVLSAVRGADGVELHVRDEGRFPEELLPRAFERFSRAEAAAGTAGTGLGLAIVDVIARSHRGSARVVGNGETDVWVSLPGA